MLECQNGYLLIQIPTRSEGVFLGGGFLLFFLCPAFLELEKIIETASKLLESDMKSFFLIHSHALISLCGKASWMSDIGDYAILEITSTLADIIYDCYLGEDSIKCGTRAKQMNKKKNPILRLGPTISLQFGIFFFFFNR